MEEKGEILKRLDILETRHEEKWLAHDKNSDMHWLTIKDQLAEIKESISELVTCKEYKEAVSGIKGHIKGLWGTIGAVGLAIFTLFIRSLGFK